MLSIVVIFFNMQREGPRTLKSLAMPYQRNVSPDDYEVIAIDNGSSKPLDPDFVNSLGSNFRHHYHETKSVSPAEAMNLGVKLATGDAIAVIVDGARMASPGLVNTTIKGLRLYERPFVSALAWHIGHDVQNVLLESGYTKDDEDQLLESIDWPDDGYRLFEISTMAPSSRPGLLGGVPAECSWLALRKQQFLDLGGYDERFQTPGGGLVNHEFVNRVMNSGNFELVAVLGEGVFHQMHGGVATNVPRALHPLKTFQDEFQDIQGTRYIPAPPTPCTYLGSMPSSAFRFLNTSPESIR